MGEEKTAEAPKTESISLRVIRGWLGSWVVLVMAIFATIAAVCGAVSLCTTFSRGIIAIIINLIQLVLSVVLCIGFWCTYATGRNKTGEMKLGGPLMLRGVLNFYRIITYIIMTLIVILIVVMFITIKSCVDDATDVGTSIGDKVDSSGEASEILKKLNSKFTGILIGLLVGSIVVYVMIIFFYQSVYAYASNAVESLMTRKVNCITPMLVPVLFFFLGIATLASAFGTSMIFSLFSDIVGRAGDKFGFLKSGLGSMAKPDVAKTLAQVSKAALYIFGGITALQYRGLNTKMAILRSRIQNQNENK